jgi:hypothetical protein
MSCRSEGLAVGLDWERVERPDCFEL